MLKLPGFHILESMYQNEEIHLYRVERIADRARMLAKTTSVAPVEADRTASFQYEYEQLLRMDGQGVLVPYGLEIVEERPVLLLHDYAGTTLDRLLRTRRASMRLSEQLTVAIAVAESIDHIHQTGHIVRELAPFYILVRDDFQEAKILSVGASVAEMREDSSKSVRTIDVMLPYVSPEQTGRTGMTPDARADVYSLAVMLYEWFAQRLPFPIHQGLDLVYDHLAIEPEPLYSTNRSIPRIVSDIVMKGLEKMPANRYASAHSMCRDLQECLVQYRVMGKVHGFALAQYDNAKDSAGLDPYTPHLDELEQLLQQNEGHSIAQREPHEWIEHYVNAGVEAKRAHHYEVALVAMHDATALLTDVIWEEHPALAYHTCMERAEVEFLCGNYTAAADMYALLLGKTTEPMEHVHLYMRMLQLEMSQDRYRETVAIGEKVLHLLGYRYRFAPTKLELTRKLIHVRWRLRKYQIETPAQLPVMTESRQIAALTALANMSDAIFAENKEGWFYSILLMLELTLDYGLLPESSHAFASYALVLNYTFHDYKSAYRWGVLACEVAQSDPGLYVRAYTAFITCFDSWRKHEPTFLLKHAEHTNEAALQSGDRWRANYRTVIVCGLLFQFGHPLKDIYIRLLAQAPKMRSENTSLHWKQATILAQLIGALTGDRMANDPFAEVDIDADGFVDGLQEEKRHLVLDLLYIKRFITGYIMGDVDAAKHAIEQSMDNIKALKDSLMEPVSHYYYHVLVLKETFEQADEQGKQHILRNIRSYVHQLKKHARRVPENYLHKYALVQAELARLQRKHRQAEMHYERALAAARSNGHIHDVGIIAECYATYGLRNNKTALARVYMHEAYDAYARWGAHAKTAAMEKQFGHLLQIKRETALEQVDYISIVRAAQALSGEMEMSRLLHTVMQIMLQNAGAQYGALILIEGEEWVVEAHGTMTDLRIDPIPITAAESLLPIALLRYSARTREAFIIHDVTKDDIFERLIYDSNKELKSMLSLPIVQHNQLIGMLYMENNLSTGMFTERRVDVLKLLSAQCAISITNAKLFTGLEHMKNSLEDQVEQRTRALEKSMQATSEALAEATVYAERTRIAQEIHDIVGHTLTSTVLQIEAGKRLLQKDKDSAIERLQEAQHLARHSLNEIRNSVHMLKEDKYYHIVQALQQLIRDTERNASVTIHAEIADSLRLTAMQKKVLYHALQEGLTNGIRHGNSTEFHFSLYVDGTQVHFCLEDNGTSTHPIEMGFGLSMMRDRVEQLRGTLAIDRTDGGCTLRIQLPHTA